MIDFKQILEDDKHIAYGCEQLYNIIPVLIPREIHSSVDGLMAVFKYLEPVPGNDVCALQVIHGRIRICTKVMTNVNLNASIEMYNSVYSEFSRLYPHCAGATITLTLWSDVPEDLRAHW